MSPFDSTIDDVATRFGLGTKAGPLMRELLLTITRSPGGLKGFIDKFKAVNTNAADTTAKVEDALGSGTVDAIAQKVGLSGPSAAAAIGYLAPKVVDQLAPNGVLDANCSQSISNFLNSSSTATDIDSTIQDLSSRFGLGAKAAPLMREFLSTINQMPGGIRSFLDKFQSAGVLNTATGTPSNLSSTEVQKALGSSTINSIAQKVGISGASAAAALGYLAPKVINKVAPNGTLLSDASSKISDFVRNLSSSDARVDQAAPTIPVAPSVSAASSDTATTRKPLGGAWWLLPLLALLALLGLLWSLMNHGTTPTTSSNTTTQGQTASSIPSQLSISNDNGQISVSGTVRDENERKSIMDMLKNAFGANAVKGDIAINPNVAPSPWLSNLRASLDQLKVPGLQATFSGKSLSLGGSVPEADRNRILDALKSLFGGGWSFAALDRLSSMAYDSNNKATAALSSLGSNFKTSDLLAILNKSIINFPTASADVPPTDLALLQQAAGKFKQLPAGSHIEISGYTDNTGNAAANLQLSQQRADAVKNALVQAGVPADMLTSKGYGSADPVASNDTPEGRFQNRRIEYRAQ